MKCETTSISPEKSNYKIQSILYIILILYLSTIIPCQAKIIILKESVKVKHRIKSAQQKEIERDLREKAGLKSLRFDENGMLIFNKTEKPEKGSKKFRQLITGAIQDQNNIFEIVNYSNSGEFHFAKIDEGTTIALTENKGQRIVENGRVTIYRIMIDFADYKNSQRYSHKEVLQSHTIGITLFHEINHKVSYDLTDPIPAGGIRPDKSSSSIRRGN